MNKSRKVVTGVSVIMGVAIVVMITAFLFDRISGLKTRQAGDASSFAVITQERQNASATSSDPFTYGGGQYVFDESISPGNDLYYTLMLTSNGGRLRGDIRISVNNSDSDILDIVNTVESPNSDGSYNVYFDSYEGNVSGGFEIFKKGDILFVLIPTASGDARIKWIKLQPKVESSVGTAVFKRTHNTDVFPRG
jgi:hypothetical protein